MMSEKNKLTATVGGYNVCPTCGREAYEMMSGYDEYHVGCAYCGIHNGVVQFLDDYISTQTKEQVRKEWNKKCITSEYGDSVLEMLGDYVVVCSSDHAIEFTSSNIKDVVTFVEERNNNYDVYIIMENQLEYLGCSYLIHLINSEG